MIGFVVFGKAFIIFFIIMNDSKWCFYEFVLFDINYISFASFQYSNYSNLLKCLSSSVFDSILEHCILGQYQATHLLGLTASSMFRLFYVQEGKLEKCLVLH